MDTERRIFQSLSLVIGICLITLLPVFAETNTISVDNQPGETALVKQKIIVIGRIVTEKDQALNRIVYLVDTVKRGDKILVGMSTNHTGCLSMPRGIVNDDGEFAIIVNPDFIGNKYGPYSVGVFDLGSANIRLLLKDGLKLLIDKELLLDRSGDRIQDLGILTFQKDISKNLQRVCVD